MGRSIQPWKQSILCGGLLVVLGTQTAWAQTAPIGSGSDPNQDIDNIFNNRDESAASMFSLLNRLQMLNGRSPADFAAEQNENFDSAVSEFRKKQQQKFQPPVAPSTPPLPQSKPLP